MNNIIFIGGIHGVGKGTLCKEVCTERGLKHLSASEVLKWVEISEKENKLVADFPLSQNRLIRNLQHQVKASEKYLLDGHYCLLNPNLEPEKIDFETFELLNPFAFSIVVDEIQEIKNRLEKRDNREYSYDLLSKFQQIELQYSIEIADKLNKPHLILRKEEAEKLVTFLIDENFT
jgi:adenylate kinase